MCVHIYTYTYIICTQSLSFVSKLILCKIATLLPQQYFCSLIPELYSEDVLCLLSKTSWKILEDCRVFLTVKIRNYLSIWAGTEMKWGMAATKQKICSLYVCQLITTLQRRFWKDKASCINLAVIQAGKTNLQGMALSSFCSFLRKLTLDIWAQFRKCLIFFFLFPAQHNRILNSIQYLSFKRHYECCRQYSVITAKQKYIFIYVHTYDCPSCQLSCLLVCASESSSPYVWGDGGGVVKEGSLD